jgi:hypothetical protein
MSFNDMISTGIGGIARGEAMYRISSLILDNTRRGKGRFGREAAALLVDPARGFNRVVSGDASEVNGNPTHPYDWRPPFQLHVRAGPRIMGEGESISENTNTYGFLEVALSYGDPWDPENRRPYDRFDVVSQSNFGDKTRLGRLLIRGDLVSKPVGRNHSLALQQDFDYIDNEAYEYGGQSLGPALLSRFGTSRGLTLYSRLQAYAILLGAVNSDYSCWPTWRTRSGSGSTTTVPASGRRSSSSSSAGTAPSRPRATGTATSPCPTGPSTTARSRERSSASTPITISTRCS